MLADESGMNSSADMQPDDGIDDASPFIASKKGIETHRDEGTSGQGSGFLGIPGTGWLILLVELCERMAYYGISTVYVLDMKELLGFGNQGVFATTNAFMFWCYATVLLGGWVADAYLGRKKTIMYFSGFYIIGLITLTVSSSPAGFDTSFDSPAFAINPSSRATWAKGGLAVSLFFIGLGTGGIKANVSPMVAEQLQDASDEVIERVFRYFYWAINLGAVLGMLVTPYLKRVGGILHASANATNSSGLLEESAIIGIRGRNITAECASQSEDRYSGYYVAFGLMGVVFLVGMMFYLLGYSSYVSAPPSGSLLQRCFGIMKKARRKKRAAAKRGRAVPEGPSHAHWLDWAVDESTPKSDRDVVKDLKMTLRALAVFVPFPVYFLLYSQMSNNFITQATMMNMPKGITADQIGLVDPVTLIILIPIFDAFVFPFLRNKCNLELNAITRMIIGFCLVAFAMIYAGVIQMYIDDSIIWCPGKNPENKFVEAFPGSKVSIFLQVPAYLLIAVSEIFASVAALEFAYSQAPASMKSIVMSMSLFTSAIANAIGLAISPVIKVKDYAVIFFIFGGIMLLFTAGFFFAFRGGPS